jgi:hypothetical protein
MDKNQFFAQALRKKKGPRFREGLLYRTGSGEPCDQRWPSGT